MSLGVNKMWKMKIGRNEYEITERDVFLDNGHCIQCLTKRKMDGWFEIPIKLTKKAEKELLSQPHTRTESDKYKNCYDIRIKTDE